MSQGLRENTRISENIFWQIVVALPVSEEVTDP